MTLLSGSWLSVGCRAAAASAGRGFPGVSPSGDSVPAATRSYSEFESGLRVTFRVRRMLVPGYIRRRSAVIKPSVVRRSLCLRLGISVTNFGLWIAHYGLFYLSEPLRGL